MMKAYLSFIFSCLVLCAASQDLQVMSYNIRLNLASDSMNAWPYRKDKLVSVVLFHEAHLLGVQEALPEQMADLQLSLPAYKYVGVGREDGKMKGEFSAVFYDTTRIQLLQSNTFWLSTTPTTAGSKSWDAALPRIATWAKCRDRVTKKIFFVFNTHFDHRGTVARRESALLLKQEVHRIAGTSPVIIMGDFNAKPADEPIRIMLEKTDPLRFTDTRELSKTPHYGPDGTFNGFGPAEVDNQPIDYIFIKGNWKVKRHATISQTWQGRFASDHFAVLARLAL